MTPTRLRSIVFCQSFPSLMPALLHTMSNLPFCSNVCVNAPVNGERNPRTLIMPPATLRTSPPPPPKKKTDKNNKYCNERSEYTYLLALLTRIRHKGRVNAPEREEGAVAGDPHDKGILVGNSCFYS